MKRSVAGQRLEIESTPGMAIPLASGGQLPRMARSADDGSHAASAFTRWQHWRASCPGSWAPGERVLAHLKRLNVETLGQWWRGPDEGDPGQAPVAQKRRICGAETTSASLVEALKVRASLQKAVSATYRLGGSSGGDLSARCRLASSREKVKAERSTRRSRLRAWAPGRANMGQC